MARKTRTIDSMEELFEAVPEVFEAINADPALAMRFAVNPLFLAEELGYKLSDEMKHFAARRVRFSTETFERMVELEAQIWEHAGERFDIDSGEAVSDLLFKRLKLPTSKPKRPSRKAKKEQEEGDESAPAAEMTPVIELAAPLPIRMMSSDPATDPLEYLRDEHPIMEPLLEYRQLEASSARLAPRPVYERIKERKADLPVGKLKFEFKGFKNRK